MIKSEEIKCDWNSMIDLTCDNPSARAICLMLGGLLDARNETNRLLATIASNLEMK